MCLSDLYTLSCRAVPQLITSVRTILHELRNSLLQREYARVKLKTSYLLMHHEFTQFLTERDHVRQSPSHDPKRESAPSNGADYGAP